MQTSDLKELNSEAKEQYQIRSSNRITVLENLDDEVDINRVWEKY
jgi:putative IMPACT (imprinted ancient) family translation regulator